MSRLLFHQPFFIVLQSIAGACSCCTHDLLVGAGCHAHGGRGTGARSAVSIAQHRPAKEVVSLMPIPISFYSWAVSLLRWLLKMEFA